MSHETAIASEPGERALDNPNFDMEATLVTHRAGSESLSEPPSRNCVANSHVNSKSYAGSATMDYQ